MATHTCEKKITELHTYNLGILLKKINVFVGQRKEGNQRSNQER